LQPLEIFSRHAATDDAGQRQGDIVNLKSSRHEAAPSKEPKMKSNTVRP